MSTAYIIAVVFYVYSVLFSFFVVSGQALYNRAVNDENFELTTRFLFSKKMLGLITNPMLISGFALFLGATAVSFWMYTKYDFSNIQAATVPIILVLSYLVNYWFFDGSLGLANIIGFAIIVFGVFVATGSIF